MYRIPENVQMALEDFELPFGGKLDAGNRWAEMSGYVPWELVEEIYASKFKNERPDGKKPIPSRIAFGAIFIKEHENLVDVSTVQHIAENPYMQFFLGLRGFQTEPLFDASMLTHFRKRFSAEDVKRINEELYRRMHEGRYDNNDDDTGGGDSSDTDSGSQVTAEENSGAVMEAEDSSDDNKGTLVLDATVGPSDIRYPTDISLLNECREECEKMLDKLWPHTARAGHKTPYSRKKARKNYLALVKQRKPRRTAIRKAVGLQLEYLSKAIAAVEKLIAMADGNVLPSRKLERLRVIMEVYHQQIQMAQSGTRSCDDRIVSLRQPHVRPIKRGKAGRETEFGQKLALAVVDGFTFIEKQSWDNFAEGVTLIDSAERYRERHGVYPKAILADMTYRNRKNLDFCKAHHIRLSGPRLGRPKESEREQDKQQAYQDSCDRNIVEGRNGTVKRRFGLDLVMAYLSDSAMTEAALAIFAMNVSHCMRLFMRWFCECGFRWRIAVCSDYGLVLQ